MGIKDNHFLGKFDLTGIAAAPRGVPQIEVSFEVDVNGILRVSAQDKGSGKEETIKIDQTDGSGLSKEEIERMTREGEEFAEQDRVMKEQIDAKNGLEGYAYSVKNQASSEFKEKLTPGAIESIETSVSEVLEWLESNQAATAEEYKEKQQDLENTVKSLMQDGQKDEL